MGVAVADYDGDGRMDVFVTNDRVPHFLYRNGKDGPLQQVGVRRRGGGERVGALVSGMGCDFEDFDEDGRPDIFADRPERDVFTLFVNQGTGCSSTRPSRPGSAPPRSRTAAGARRSSTSTATAARTCSCRLARGRQRHALQPDRARTRRAASSTATWAAGASRTCPTGSGPDIAQPRRLARAGGGRLRQRRHARGGGVPAERHGRAVREAGRGAHNWILLDLAGTRSNRDGIGARVRLVLPSGRTLHEHVTTAHGIYSASDRRVHFGLGPSPPSRTSRSRGRAASCSASTSRSRTRCCASWRRTRARRPRSGEPRPRAPAARGRRRGHGRERGPGQTRPRGRGTAVPDGTGRT